MSKIKHPFDVIEGKGKRGIGDPFVSSAQLTPVPTLPNAKELKRFTANLIMHDMFEAFQSAHEEGFKGLAILQDHTLGGFQFYSFKDEDELLRLVPSSKANTVPIKKTGLELQFTFHLTKPFTDQFPTKYIKSVRDTNNILKAFIDIAEQHHFDNGGYGDFSKPELIQGAKEPKPRINIDDDWQASANPDSPYSEKIQRIHEKFDSARETAIYNNFYVILNGDDDLTQITFKDAHSITDANNFLQRENPLTMIIMALDLSKDFDTQIRSGRFDPEQLKDWDSLKAYPLSCLSDIKLLPHEKIAGLLSPPERKIHILGPPKPTLIVDNNAPKP